MKTRNQQYGVVKVNPRLADTIRRARNHPSLARSPYARAVLSGEQNWSGSDLAGKAKRYGATYRVLRDKAARALAEAGGCIVSVEHGRLVSAVQIGVDDYGDALYAACDGVYMPHAHKSSRLRRVW